MWSKRWRFWLAALLLIVLPLKGMAAIGAVLCCPPEPARAPHHAMAADHAAPVAADQASGHYAEPADSHARHGSADDGAQPDAAHCCGGAALAAQAPAWPGAVAERAALALPPDGGYQSAALAAYDKPPRS